MPSFFLLSACLSLVSLFHCQLSLALRLLLTLICHFICLVVLFLFVVCTSLSLTFFPLFLFTLSFLLLLQQLVDQFAVSAFGDFFWAPSAVLHTTTQHSALNLSTLLFCSFSSVCNDENIAKIFTTCANQMANQVWRQKDGRRLCEDGVCSVESACCQRLVLAALSHFPFVHCLSVCDDNCAHSVHRTSS